MLDLGRDYFSQKFYKQAIGMLQVVLNNAQILSSTSPDEVDGARSMCENARRILATTGPRAVPLLHRREQIDLNDTEAINRRSRMTFNHSSGTSTWALHAVEKLCSPLRMELMLLVLFLEHDQMM